MKSLEISEIMVKSLDFKIRTPFGRVGDLLHLKPPHHVTVSVTAVVIILPNHSVLLQW